MLLLESQAVFNHDNQLSASPGSVRIFHGSNDDILHVAGSSVAAVRTSLKDAFSLPQIL